MIRCETPFQAILATSLSQAHTILQHLMCDFVLLADDTFPLEDLERLCKPEAATTVPTMLNLTFLSRTYNYRNMYDRKSIV